MLGKIVSCSVKKRRAYQGCVIVCEIILTVQQVVTDIVFLLLVFLFVFSLLVFLPLVSLADRSQVLSLDLPSFLFIPAFYAISSTHGITAIFVHMVLRGTSLFFSFSEL